MNRKERVRKAYQNGEGLHLGSEPYKLFVDSYLVQTTQQDYGRGDITTQSIFNGERGKTIVEVQQDGVIAGIEEALYYFSTQGVDATAYVRDGTIVSAGQCIIRKSGKIQILLHTERTGLNLLQRMSGIATTTQQYVTEAGIPVAATRKTDLGLLDKKAVALGGGYTHRLGLYDAIMIKDTHLDQLRAARGYNQLDAISDALKACAGKHPEANIKIETQTLEEALWAAEIFQTVQAKEKILMLDNFPADKVAETIQALKTAGLYKSVLLEASGGITFDCLKEYAKAGSDIILVGLLTSDVKKISIHEVAA